MTTTRPAGSPVSWRSAAAHSMAATEALASPEPRPYNRVPSMAGVNGSRVQPAPGGTTSRWDTSASVGPAARPRTSTRTDASSRTTSRPQLRVVCSTKSASGPSSPLTEGIATRPSSSVSSSGKIDPEVGRLFLPSDDHGATPGTSEHLEQERIRRPAIDDVGALDPAGGRADAGLDFGPHPTAQHAIGHEPSEVVGIGEGHQSGGIGAIAEHPGRAGEEDQLLGPERHGQRLGHRIGVDVDHLAVLPAGQTRHHGHEPRLEQGDEHAGVHPVYVAYVAEVHLLAGAVVVDHLHRPTPVSSD